MKKLKQAKMQRRNNPAPPSVPAVFVSRGWLPLPRWIILGLCLVLAAGGTLIFCEFVLWNEIPSELVGKWVVVGGPQEGATFDFFRSGRLVGKVNLGGKEGKVDARIRVEGQKIFSTTTHPRTGQDDIHIQVIRRVTAKDLVLEDEQGQLLKMERAD